MNTRTRHSTQAPTANAERKNKEEIMNKQTLNEILSSPYTIYLYGEVNETLAKETIQKISEITKSWNDNYVPDNERKLVVRINSPGGIIAQGYAILDNLKATEATIVTIAEGTAASISAILLAVAGTKGYRFAFKNASIMIHQPIGGVQGQAVEVEIVAERIKKTRHRLNALLAEATGQSIEKIEAATDRDNYMSAEEALEFGLIDYII